MKPRVLVIQGDDELRTRMCAYLEDARMQALGVANHLALSGQPAAIEYDVVVCEVDPLLEGCIEGFARLRGIARAGVIALARSTRREDRIHALTLGADYYLVPPLDLEELELLIRNLCRRTVAPGEPHPALNGHSINGSAAAEAVTPARQLWCFDRMAWALTAPTGRSMRVSQTEYQILSRLMEQTGQVVERQSILAALGDEYLQVYNRNLDMMISRLRRKVRDRCGMPLPVHSARGVGYVFTGAGEVVGGE